MPIIPVDRVVDKKKIIGKNGGPKWRRGTRGHDSCFKLFFLEIEVLIGSSEHQNNTIGNLKCFDLCKVLNSELHKL
jgi:hypothetical protein